MGYYHEVLLEMTPKAYEKFIEALKRFQDADPKTVDELIRWSHVSKCGKGKYVREQHMCLTLDDVGWDTAIPYCCFLMDFMHDIDAMEHEDYGVHFARIGENLDDMEDQMYGYMDYQVNIERSFEYDYEPEIRDGTLCL